MNILNIIVDVEKTLGTTMLLTDVRPAYKYDSGKRLNDIEGYRYEIVLVDRKYDKIAVKIAGSCKFNLPLESPVRVEFDNLDVKLYWRSGTYDISATASDIRETKGITVKRE